MYGFQLTVVVSCGSAGHLPSLQEPLLAACLPSTLEVMACNDMGNLRGPDETFFGCSKQGLRSAHALQAFAVRDRMHTWPAVALGTADIICQYCYRSMEHIRARAAGNPGLQSAVILHRCVRNSATGRLCPYDLLAGKTEDCGRNFEWPLPPGNGLLCSNCDVGTQLCTSHRWACPELLLCRDCMYQERPLKIISVTPAISTTWYGTIMLSLLARKSFSGELIAMDRDTLPPDGYVIAKAGYDWLMLLVAGMYKEETTGARYCSEWEALTFRQLQERLVEQGTARIALPDITTNEWSLGGWRSFSVGVVIFDSEDHPSRTFYEHQLSEASAYMARVMLPQVDLTYSESG